MPTKSTKKKKKLSRINIITIFTIIFHNFFLYIYILHLKSWFFMLSFEAHFEAHFDYQPSPQTREVVFPEPTLLTLLCWNLTTTVDSPNLKNEKKRKKITIEKKQKKGHIETYIIILFCLFEACGPRQSGCRMLMREHYIRPYALKVSLQTHYFYL
jgi:hypothetical protein